MTVLRHIKIYDGDKGPAEIDPASYVLEGIDSAHAKIHEGDHYYIQGYLELEDGISYRVKMVTPAIKTWSHLTFSIKSSGICATTLDEGAAGGMGSGSLMIPKNNNRNSDNTSGLVFTAGVDAAAGYDIRIENDKWGADGFKQTVGGGGTREDELVLKEDTTYLRTFTSGAGSNIIQFKATWYELEDKSIDPDNYSSSSSSGV